MIDNRQQAVVVLEDVHDPHNAEAVFRSCDAMGVHHINLVFIKQKPWDPVGMGHSSSATSHKWLEFTTYHSTEQCIGELRDDGFQIIATCLRDDSVSLYEADLTAPKVAIMVGNEHRGLSDTAINLADSRLMVPMRGMVQSLNLSVTTALCLFEMTRQRLAKGMDGYGLDPAVKDDIFETLIDR